MLFLSAVSLRSAESTPLATPSVPRDLLLEMDLEHVETLAGDGLRLTAILSNDGEKAVLEVQIPPKKVQKGEKVRGAGAATYRFPVYLRANDADAAAFERSIAAHFGAKPPDSFVRKEEYGGGALQKPGKLGREGGTIFLTDPTGTPFNWEITIQIDPAKRRLTLKAGETRYR